MVTIDRLRAVNGMITGFHEPHATHLAMIEQVIVAAGGEPCRHTSIARIARRSEAGYLWHEFGDSHLIIGGGAFSACDSAALSAR